MLAVLAAIFAVGISLELEKKNRAEEKHIKWKRRYDYLDKLVRVTPEYEQEVEDYVRSGKNVYEIYEKIEDNLISAFGDDYPKKFLLPGIKGYHCYYQDVTDGAYWAKMLLLSKEGKIASHELLYGFPLGRTPDNDFCIRMCKEVERNLIAAGVDTKLMMKTYLHMKSPDGNTVYPDYQIYCPEPAGRLW